MKFSVLSVLLVCLAVPWSSQGVSGSPGYGRVLFPRQRSWMREIADNKALFLDLTIPGTHNSGVSNHVGSHTYQCQSTTVLEQLNAGVRFLDVSLAFIDSELRVVQDSSPSKHNTILFETVLRDVETFLTTNYWEVVIMRLSEEDVATNAASYQWRADIFNNIIVKYRGIRDTQCRSMSCTIGLSRGLVVFLDNNLPEHNQGFLRYQDVLPYAQEMSQLSERKKLYSKWMMVRDVLMNVASNRRTKGAINFLSAAGAPRVANEVPPYFVASGQSSPLSYPLRWTGISKDCWDPQWNVYPDFPRASCHSCGKGTVCSIYYHGTNNLLHDWLLNGRLGNPQSRETTYVWPRNLGILVMDFPDNAVLDEIIAVNHAGSRSPYKGVLLIPRKCIMLDCASCIAGDAEIATESRGVVAARDVAVGDRIPGMQDGEWCEVVTAVRTKNNGTVFGNFTQDHLVVGQTNLTSPSYILRSNGVNTPARPMDLVNIATTCPAARTSAGELFTPISTVFCPNLTWAQYVPLYGAIMRIVGKTGGFWFDPSIYNSSHQDNTSQASASDSSTQSNSSPGWMEALPGICELMLSCAVDDINCDEFERTIADWIKEYVPSASYAKVERVYPNLGNPAASHGNFLEDVRPSGNRYVVVIIVVTVIGIFALLAAALVLRMCWKKRASKAMATPIDRCPDGEVSN